MQEFRDINRARSRRQRSLEGLCAISMRVVHAVMCASLWLIRRQSQPTLLGMDTGTPRSVRTVVLSRLMASTTPDTMVSPPAVSSATRSPLLNVLLKNCGHTYVCFLMKEC